MHDFGAVGEGLQLVMGIDRVVSRFFAGIRLVAEFAAGIGFVFAVWRPGGWLRFVASGPGPANGLSKNTTESREDPRPGRRTHNSPQPDHNATTETQTRALGHLTTSPSKRSAIR